MTKKKYSTMNTMNEICNFLILNEYLIPRSYCFLSNRDNKSRTRNSSFISFSSKLSENNCENLEFAKVAFCDFTQILIFRVYLEVYSNQCQKSNYNLDRLNIFIFIKSYTSYKSKINIGFYYHL